MIRYNIKQADLEAKVDTVKANWRSRARKRTELFRRANAYSDPPAPFWSEIKPVFMEIQNDKCAYCERQLAAKEHGKIEHDVEHFRPKSAVAAWPPDGSRHSYSFATGGDFAGGCYLLAYNLLNYVVACKPCNSDYKRNYFPIASSRIAGKDDPTDLTHEKPLLICPIGENIDDPCALIRFDGPIPLPVSSNSLSYDYQRARVTIDLFELDTRDDLLRERLRLICALFIALRGAQAGLIYEQRCVKVLMSPTSPHTNCSQCFAMLFAKDQAAAEAFAAQALAYLESVHDTFILNQ